MTPGCEEGFHAPVIAREPVAHAGCVNVDYVCPACGGIEYTVSWTEAAWQERLEKQRAKQAKAAQTDGAA